MWVGTATLKMGGTIPKAGFWADLRRRQVFVISLCSQTTVTDVATWFRFLPQWLLTMADCRLHSL